jgi:menaquinol-cytochrome c reductase iron-sulfur subunit
LSQAAAAVFGCVALAGPAVAALVAFLNPLREKSAGGRMVRLAELSALPEDGTPRKFPVIADRNDAWNRFPSEPIGAVFLRRVGKQVEAYNVICPHAGCFVTYEAKENIFFCPCHIGRFELNGKRIGSASPSPRDLDTLEVELRSGNEVWVKFENFQTNTPQKKPLA